MEVLRFFFVGLGYMATGMVQLQQVLHEVVL